MDKQFDTPDPIELVVELGAGGIHTEATETETTSVTITGPRAEEFSVELHGRRLSVIAPRHRSSFFGGNDNHEVHVMLPTGSDLSTKTGSADTQAVGTYGSVRAKTGSGDIDLDSAEDSVDLVSGSGELRCDSAAATVRVRTGSGDVELGSVRQSLSVSTGSGDLTVGNAQGATVAKTGSGSLEILRHGGDLTLTTGSGNIGVARAERGRIRAKTGSGDVRVGVPAGTPVWTEVSSATGRVRSDLAPVGKPAAGQDHLELRLQTATGDIALSQV